MNLFKKATEIKEFQLGNMIALVVDNFKPVNGKGVILKAESNKKLIFKATEIKEGRAFGTFMIANEIDSQGDFYSEETVKKAYEQALKMEQDGNPIQFNINHNGKIVKGVFAEQHIYNEDLKAWQGWVNFKQSPEIMQKAISGNFEGFSIEGLGVRVEKATSFKETQEEQRKNNSLMQATSNLQRTIDDIMFSELSDIDKKGSLELAVLDYFDFANKEIDSIFNIDNDTISKSQNFTEEVQMKPEEFRAEFFKCMKEWQDEQKISKAEEDRKKEIAELKKANEEQGKEIEELKKAIAENGQPKKESEEEPAKVEKAETNEFRI